jgi:GntR family transcriptional repressor for pyruvate dehydrogenase complex
MLETYGVARATLREALRLLETQGVIRVKAGVGGGPVVADLSELPVHFTDTAKLHFQRLGVRNRDVLAARGVIEPAAARFAAENADPQVLDRLQAIMATAEQMDVNDDTAYVRHSIDFHAAITEASGNPVLDLLALSLRALSPSTEFRVRQLPVRDRHAVVATHAAITQAILDGHGERAEQLVREHMADTTQVADEQVPDALDSPIVWD